MNNNRLTNEDELFFNSLAARNILILCKGNTCRSIIYHSIMDTVKGPNTKLFSAGIDVQKEDIEKYTIETLINNNIKPIKYHTEKINKFKDIYFDDVILLDKNIIKPNYIKSKRILNLDIEDPFEKDMEVYQKVFNNIKEEVFKFQ